ncbi:MAG: (2Fe-2S)-binding protein [Candidatus Omnitrophica bacterium]|nr:(2Fe-2S)-binding protein [Candidatus Omnitrophota bacterium]
MPTLTIDGQQVTVPPGTTIIQAADQLGITIPRYCYHPGLSIAGNCRICLVEVEKAPKLQIACYTPVADGMVVHTGSDKTLKARQEVLEFLLANHPLDCPVCDQAGECELQNYYMDHGRYEARFLEQKVKKSKKATPIGPTVMLDQERCILCSRCVRFTDEISKTSELGIFHRGDHAELDVVPGRALDNAYAGNVVDICPVGALTDRDFRFKARVWYLSSSPSVCPGCSRGCNIEIHYVLDRPYLADGARVMRLKPRYNPAVNQWWMCDEGRYGYKAIDRARLVQPMGRTQGLSPQGTVPSADSVSHPLVWDLAMTEAAQHLQEAQTRNQLGQWGVLPSPQMTNEELFLARQLFQERLGVACDGRVAERPATGDNFLMTADKSPNRRGMAAIFSETTDQKGTVPQGDSPLLAERAAAGELKGLIVFDHDLVALYGEAVARTVAQRVFLIYVGSHDTATSRLAHLVLPSAVYAEKDGTFTNVDGRVQRIVKAFEPLSGARGGLEIVADLARRLGAAFPHTTAAEVFRAIGASVPAFQGLTYETLGAHGAPLATAEAVTV